MNDASHASTVLARVVTDGKTARRLADGIAEVFDPGETAIAAFEARDGSWTLEIYFEDAPNEAALRRLVGDLAGDAVRDWLTFESVEPRDWVAASLEGLHGRGKSLPCRCPPPRASRPTAGRWRSAPGTTAPRGPAGARRP
jgi:hypothetical protein